MKLEIQGISKSFGASGNNRRVLDRLTLSIEFPHVVALLGPSGGGKSTLLRLIAGLELPDTGAISLDGTIIPKEVSAL